MPLDNSKDANPGRQAATEGAGALDNVCWFSGEPMEPWLVVPGDWRAPRARPGPFAVYRAPTSGFAWVYPRPSLKDVASFYALDDYYTHDAGPSARPGLADRALRRAAWTLDASRDTDVGWARDTFGQRGARILDVGAGDGAFAAVLEQAGHSVLCVEPDPVCRARIAARNINVVDGTAESLPLTAGELFDGVTIIHVLEHARDPARALAELHARLRPGGTLVVEVPNGACLGLERGGFTWAFFDVPRHLSFFDPAGLRRAVEHAGFTVEREELRGFTRQYLPAWIHEEQRIHDALDAAGAGALPARSTRARAWMQLGRALLSPPVRRYDSVRIVAVKPHDA